MVVGNGGSSQLRINGSQYGSTSRTDDGDREQCGSRPCVRGLRIRVTDVLDLLASGFSQE